MNTLTATTPSRDFLGPPRASGATGWPARLVGGYQIAAGLVLAVFWLRSGLAHMANPYYFLSSVYSYELVGPALGQAAAMVLPVLQLVLAVCLVTRQIVGGALFSSVLS